MAPKKLRIGVLFRPEAPHDAFEDPLHGNDDTYYVPLLRGISEAAATTNSVVLSYCYRPPGEWMSFVGDNALDGAVMVAVGLADPLVVREMMDGGVPCVAIGTSSSFPLDADLPCIDTLNRESGALAARHLIDLGHRRLACVNLTTSYSNHSERMQGYRAAAASAGVPLDPAFLLTRPQYDHAEFYNYLDGWLDPLRRADNLPTAIFACDFNMAEAAIAVLDRYRIGIPHQMSIVGFDDFEAAASLNPPLTVLRQPVYEMGVRAVEKLLEAFRDEDGGHGAAKRIGGTERYPCELIVRGSTAAPPV